MGIRWFSSGTKVTSSLFFFSSLQKDDKLALMVTPERELIFFLNGRQIGTGTATTREAVYVLCEIHFGCRGDSVKLIPDLRDVTTVLPKVRVSEVIATRLNTILGRLAF